MSQISAYFIFQVCIFHIHDSAYFIFQVCIFHIPNVSNICIFHIPNVSNICIFHIPGVHINNQKYAYCYFKGLHILISQLCILLIITLHILYSRLHICISYYAYFNSQYTVIRVPESRSRAVSVWPE